MKLLKKIGKWAIYLFIIMATLFIAGSHIMDSIMYQSDEEVLAYFTEYPASGTVEYVSCGDVKMRVVRASSGKRKACIIFSHGAPGSWDAFKGFLVDENLLEMADLISYDRPGYGNSDPDNSYIDIGFQGRCLNEIMLSRTYDKYFLVGHSYGGPIVMEASMLNSEQVKGAVLLAPVVDPETEKYFPGGKLAYWSWSRWVWPKGFQVSADEKYSHADELNQFKNRLRNYNTPTLFLHSMDDWIAPSAGNVAFMNDMVPDSIYHSRIYDDKGHLFIWTDQEMVVELILEFIRGDLKEND